MKIRLIIIQREKIHEWRKRQKENKDMPVSEWKSLNAFQDEELFCHET